MAKGNMLLGYAKGKVGSLVYSRLRGEQITRAYNAKPANPRSESQQLQRTKLANLVNFYRRGRSLLNHSFTNKKENQSSYNAFVSRNINVNAVRLTKNEAAAAMSVVGPFTISDGVLPPIQINGGGVNAVTNIAVGSFVIADETTTVAQLSAAIINNNAEWMEGDQLTYVSVVQNGGVDGGYPFVQFSYIEMDLNLSDNTLLRTLFPAYALSIRNGFIGHGEYVADGGFAYIHSRKSSTGALQASRQELILTANTLYNEYSGDAQSAAATRSYGASQDYLLVPDGSRAGQETEGVPVIASTKIGSTILQNGMKGFGTSWAQGIVIPVTISGSNLDIREDLSPEEVVGVVFTKSDGTEVTFSPSSIVSQSKTSITVNTSTKVGIDASDYGTIVVQFNNNDGGYVEQTYTIAQPATPPAQGGNPL